MIRQRVDLVKALERQLRLVVHEVRSDRLRADVLADDRHGPVDTGISRGILDRALQHEHRGAFADQQARVPPDQVWSEPGAALVAGSVRLALILVGSIASGSRGQRPSARHSG